MQLEYRLSLKELQEWNRVNLKFNRDWLNLFFHLLIGQALYLLLILVIYNTKINLSYLVFVIPLLLLLSLPYFSIPFSNYVLKLLWKKSTILLMLHPVIIINVDEDKIKIKTKTDHNESTMQWQIYNKVIETQTLFMLYQRKFSFPHSLFITIPKRAFSNDEQVNEFRELLRKKIEKFQQVRC